MLLGLQVDSPGCQCNEIRPHLEKVNIYIRLCLVKNLSDITYLQIAGIALHLLNFNS